MRRLLLLVLQLTCTSTLARSIIGRSLGFASPSAPESQLTWQDLGRMLLNLQSSGVSDDALVGTRFSLPNLSRTRIGPSQLPNAGRGLFASIDCKQGELLTCYPGDILVHQTTGLQNVPDNLMEDEGRLRSLLQSNCIGVSDEYGILGLPELDQDMAYAGHFANDGARPPRTEGELGQYVVESEKMANAQHLPLENLHVVTVALRDIQKDEEIFVSYGPEFWRDHESTWKS